MARGSVLSNKPALGVSLGILVLEGGACETIAHRAKDGESDSGSLPVVPQAIDGARDHIMIDSEEARVLGGGGVAGEDLSGLGVALGHRGIDLIRFAFFFCFKDGHKYKCTSNFRHEHPRNVFLLKRPAKA